MPVIHHADARRTETPNGVMTTFASPAQGGTGIVLCRSALHPDAEGPLHVADAEQIWTVVAGGGDVEVDGDRRPIAEGDTVVLRAAARAGSWRAPAG
ncbi:cupin domain-containing protein [Actinomadura namibiensis]|uniref:cupin domain-containing protein n=1 Tax=Actinomadura kijaniata TaxID=46161 RepID=UPI0036226E16